MPETPTAVVRDGSAASFINFLRGRGRTLVGDDRRLAVAAVVVAVLSVSLGIVAARLFRGDFPAAVFVAALSVGTLGILRPYVAVLAAIFVSPTFGWATFGPDVSPFQVLVAGAAIGCLFQLRAPALLARVMTRLEVVLAILFVTWIVVAASARRESADWAFVRNYVGALVFLGACAITLRTTRHRRYAVGTVIAGCTATAAVGLAQLLTTKALVSAWVLPNVHLLQTAYTRLGSPWGLANIGSDYGKDVLVGFLIALPLALGWRRGWTQAALVVIVMLLGLGLAMSGSRSAWLGAAFALLYVALASRRLRLAVPLVAVAGALVFLIFRPATPVDIQVAVGLPGQSVRSSGEERENLADPSVGSQPQRFVIGGTKDPFSTEVSNKLRRRLTTAGLEMVRDHPLFGVGAGAFRNYVDGYEPIAKTDERIDERKQLPAHNVFIEIWAGSGTPAVLFYMALLGAVLLRLHRARSDENGRDLYTGATAAMLGLGVTSAFHNYQYDNLIWVLSGIAASVALWGLSDPRVERSTAAKTRPGHGVPRTPRRGVRPPA
jgi:hypothetical protein